MLKQMAAILLFGLLTHQDLSAYQNNHRNHYRDQNHSRENRGISSEGFGSPQIQNASTAPIETLKNVSVMDFGKVIYTGSIDLNPTLIRIRNGIRLPHRNDGSIFGNREGHLPQMDDRTYYREFVVKMEGMPFPGPQRLIIGKMGEIYYTADHYNTFRKVLP